MWSCSRDEKGRRLARSTYSPFVMASMQLLERRLVIEGTQLLVCRRAVSSGVPRFKSC